MTAPHSHTYGNAQLAVNGGKGCDEGEQEGGERNPQFKVQDEVHIEIQLLIIKALQDGECIICKRVGQRHGCKQGQRKDDNDFTGKEHEEVARASAHRAAQCHFARTEGEELQFHF